VSAAGVSIAPPAGDATATLTTRAARGSKGRTVPLALLVATLAMLPFEGAWLRSLAFGDGRWVITDVELLALLAIGAWALVLVAERRLPRLPRGVALALAALVAVTWVSAATAGPNSLLGYVVATRATLAWALFLVAADLLEGRRVALVVVAAIVATCTFSALAGWLAAVQGSMDGIFGAGRLFTIGGVPRMAGTWDYPTIAAMAWETAALLALPLLAWRPDGDRLRRAFLVVGGTAVVAVLGGAILLSLTRGAFLGLAAGLAVVLVGAWLLRSRALAVVGVAAGVALATGAAVVYLALPLPVERLFRESDAALYGAEYTVTGRLAAPPASQIAVDLTVRNTGLATWRPDGPQPWVLAAVWLDPRTRALLVDHQVAAVLPGPVEPGGSVQLRAVVQAPGMPRELDLAWDMQQVGVVDFSERDVPVAITRVTLDRDAAARPQTATPADQLLLYPTKLPILDRSELWTAAVRLIEKHPLVGVGPDAYRRVYGAMLGLTRWDTQIHANNLVLELGATTGLLGLGAFLATVGLSLGHGARGIRDARRGDAATRRTGLLIVGAAAATAAALGHGMVDHFLVFTPMAILFWVPLGLAVALSRGLRRRGPPAESDAVAP
jgi:hypothetical protein